MPLLQWLLDTVIPGFVAELDALNVLPYDSETLATFMHRFVPAPSPLLFVPAAMTVRVQL